MNNDKCDCESCLDDPDNACSFDCDSDSQCQGCYESDQARLDAEFDIDCATGRR